MTLPKKVHLTGADNFLLMLDSATKDDASDLMNIRMLLQFDSLEKVQAMLDSIQTSPFVHWAFNLQLHKGGMFSTPYWKYIDSGRQPVVNEIVLAEDQLITEELLTKPIHLFQDPPLEFKLIQNSTTKVGLLISWHHLFMDGRGAGMLIRHLSGDLSFDASLFFRTKTQKASIIQRIKNLYEMKRVMAAYTNPIAVFSQKNTSNSLHWQTHTFSLEESTCIQNQAVKNGAKLGLNLYFLATCAFVIHRFLPATDRPLLIPVPYDGRKRGEIGPLCSNQIHFVFYKLEQQDLTSISSIVAALNHQLKTQIAAELPKKYNLLLDTMRYFPQGVFRKMALKAGKSNSSSFLYSSAGEANWDLANVASAAIEDILLIPPFSVHPGITFSFSQVNQLIKLNITYNAFYLSHEDIEKIKSEVVNCLLGNA